MERSLGLMCGAGVLPARMAEHARRRGWRVVAFTFDEASGVTDRADAVVPARIVELGAVLERVTAEGIASVLFSGRFSMPAVLRVGNAADATFRGFEARAQSRSGAAFVDAIIATLAARGIAVLDQRDFVGDWLVGPGCCSARPPSEEEWSDARSGLTIARTIASARIGQTVVMRHGAVVAVEAVEGTTETVRRGAELGGRGAVVVKAVAPDHDYRFDAPAVGPETLVAAADGGVAAIAIEANRVLLFDRAEALRIADAAGIAVIGIDDPS
ncbi:MAG TPA: UDP-2,3-diacylglucosamine diphosphatase LpxI [Candidatus Acidoferrum sp.]|nr:UDP-2,3-diacylglucosamine diphosphatase LpxI [Candidatus Acidoferrum sp.]